MPGQGPWALFHSTESQEGLQSLRGTGLGVRNSSQTAQGGARLGRLLSQGAQGPSF